MSGGFGKKCFKCKCSQVELVLYLQGERDSQDPPYNTQDTDAGSFRQGKLMFIPCDRRELAEHVLCSLIRKSSCNEHVDPE